MCVTLEFPTAWVVRAARLWDFGSFVFTTVLVISDQSLKCFRRVGIVGIVLEAVTTSVWNFRM